jgi:hypothetical protein
MSTFGSRSVRSPTSSRFPSSRSVRQLPLAVRGGRIRSVSAHPGPDPATRRLPTAVQRRSVGRCHGAQRFSLRRHRGACLPETTGRPARRGVPQRRCGLHFFERTLTRALAKPSARLENYCVDTVVRFGRTERALHWLCAGLFFGMLVTGLMMGRGGGVLHHMLYTTHLALGGLLLAGVALIGWRGDRRPRRW